MNLQARTQRRLQEMKQQVEAKEAMLLKVEGVEEEDGWREEGRRGRKERSRY